VKRFPLWSLSPLPPPFRALLYLLTLPRHLYFGFAFLLQHYYSAPTFDGCSFPSSFPFCLFLREPRLFPFLRTLFLPTCWFFFLFWSFMSAGNYSPLGGTRRVPFIDSPFSLPESGIIDDKFLFFLNRVRPPLNVGLFFEPSHPRFSLTFQTHAPLPCPRFQPHVFYLLLLLSMTIQPGFFQRCFRSFKK